MGYGVHHALSNWQRIGKEHAQALKQTAGSGGMLKGTQTQIWGFDAHRLMDAMVHLGMALQFPCRVDHWVLLVLHCMKYCGRPVEEAKKMIRFGVIQLQIDDLFDVIAHSVSALYTLGPVLFFISLVLGETHRVYLKSQLHAH